VFLLRFLLPPIFAVQTFGRPVERGRLWLTLMKCYGGLTIADRAGGRSASDSGCGSTGIADRLRDLLTLEDYNPPQFVGWYWRYLGRARLSFLMSAKLPD
jgi:hypothetical protein